LKKYKNQHNRLSVSPNRQDIHLTASFAEQPG